MYSLQDAADVTGDDRYGSGSTQIFYFNKGLFSKFSRGTRGLDLNAVLADLDNTHTRIGRVNETDLSEIFNMMQGEVWSPNGEANTMPAMSKTGHTSMSMGDVIMLPNGSAYMVDFSGFTNLEDGAKKMASRNVTASDRSALIKLASSLPAGSPERKAILAGLDKTAKVDRFVGEIGGYLYAVQIEGVNPQFAQAAFGRQLDDLRLIEAWKNGAKKDWILTKPRKGQKPLPELKKWLASMGPREFYAKWDLRTYDDTRVIYFK